MPRARQPSHCPVGTRPAPWARWLSCPLVHSLVSGDQKRNWPRMTHNTGSFQQEQHFWRPRELSLGLSTSAQVPFPGDPPAPHWLAAWRPHPGFAQQPQHQAGGQLPPPPAPSVGLGKAPRVQGASSGQAGKDRLRQVTRGGCGHGPRPRSLCGQHFLCSEDRESRAGRPLALRWLPTDRQAPSRKDRRRGALRGVTRKPPPPWPLPPGPSRRCEPR